ncbi:MAG: hypothetical protein ABSG63_13995 [Spirochaetia bacterium]|jgi:hypothetical protein
MGFKRRHLLPLAVLLAAALGVTSCASFQRARDQGTIRQMVDLINAGRADNLASISATPFLLDGEIIPLQADVAAFWTGIVKAGFRVEGATYQGGVPVGPDAYRQFAETMEVKSFFTRYVKDGGRILDLATSDGRHIRLLTKSDFFSGKIIGFKGPF